MDREQRRRPFLAAAAVLAAAIALLALAAALGALAVGRGWVGGPTFTLRLGELYVIARTTTRPECLPLTQHECFISFPNPPSSAPALYAVWAGRITRLEARGSQPQVTVSKGRHLLKIVVARGELALGP